MTATDDLAALRRALDMPEGGSDVTIEGADPILDTRFSVAERTAAAIAACGLASAQLWEDRTGVSQSARVRVDHAAAALIGFDIQRVDGKPSPRPGSHPLIGLYQCRDGRWVHLHGSFPKLAERTRAVIGPVDDIEQAAAAVSRWNGLDLEEALGEAGTCGAMVRSAEEWQAHPQHRQLEALGAVRVDRIGDSEPEAAGDMHRPLGGVRVLDLTRVLAGPTHGRTLAEHGAEVMFVSAPSVPQVRSLVIDTGQGKMSTALDLNIEDDAQRLRDLTSKADVFAQSYRPGALERRGFGPLEMAALRPGLIYVSVSCYGDVQPWRGRPGWEQLAQCVTGMAHADGAGGRPSTVEIAVCDYTTGFLAAAGTMTALRRRAAHGGSYHVRVSLCQTAEWVMAGGPRHERDRGRGLPDPVPWTVTTSTQFGTVRHLPPVVEMSVTPPYWARPPVPLGTHRPEWPSLGPSDRAAVP